MLFKDFLTHMTRHLHRARNYHIRHVSEAEGQLDSEMQRLDLLNATLRQLKNNVEDITAFEGILRTFSTNVTNIAISRTPLGDTTLSLIPQVRGCISSMYDMVEVERRRMDDGIHEMEGRLVVAGAGAREAEDTLKVRKEKLQLITELVQTTEYLSVIHERELDTWMIMMKLACYAWIALEWIHSESDPLILRRAENGGPGLIFRVCAVFLMDVVLTILCKIASSPMSDM
ncbi:hypothetical protein FRC03_002686 [Tulasnella sp. 419]|nr:hypothetical protein FRC02_003773 [Tulasnella sp. 418]KAG8943060.1 hypothetical protein FRC03_002686 [Tulasnella sp. 419]